MAYTDIYYIKLISSIDFIARSNTTASHLDRKMYNRKTVFTQGYIFNRRDKVLDDLITRFYTIVFVFRHLPVSALYNLSDNVVFGLFHIQEFI